MVSLNPEYVKQSERILTFLKIARRNHLSKDLRMWIAVNYVKDVSISRNVPRVWMNLIFGKAAASLHRFNVGNKFCDLKEFMIDVLFIIMFFTSCFCLMMSLIMKFLS